MQCSPREPRGQPRGPAIHASNICTRAVRTTTITTNYAVLPLGAGGMKQDTLGDRMRSRLLELCRVVKIKGVDYRAGLDKNNPTPTRVK